MSERPTPALIAEVFEKYRPTVFFAVPTVFRMLLERAAGNRIDAASIKFSVSAGEVLPVATWNEWKALTGSEILDTIGTTELLHAFIHNYRARNRAGSSGVVLEGYEVKLTDETGAEVKGVGRGYLHVRGGSAVSYYLNKPEKTAETIRDGWVRTGDVYRRDEDGYYWFEGPQRRSFQVLGLWVTPSEVEEAVCRHPGVMEAAVIAEKTRTEAPSRPLTCCYAPATRPDRLFNGDKEEAAKTLPRYKRPQRVHFMRELPRTPTGKVQRFKWQVPAERR